MKSGQERYSEQIYHMHNSLYNKISGLIYIKKPFIFQETGNSSVLNLTSHFIGKSLLCHLLHCFLVTPKAASQRSSEHTHTDLFLTLL